MTTVSQINGTGAAPLASRQLVNRPSGSFEINAREYGSVAAGAIGLAQAAWQGGENAVSSVVHWSEDGLQALEDGAKAVGHAVSSGVSEVAELAGEVKDAVASGASTVMREAGELGSSVGAYLAAGAVAGKALVDEIL